MRGRWRTLLSIVAVMAMLLSAGGIAYMSSISYSDELGIIDARLRKHQERASQIAENLRAKIGEILAYQATLSVTQLASEREQPLFVIDTDGEIVFPLSQPFRSGATVAHEGVVPAKGFQIRQRALGRALLLENSACAAQRDDCVTSSSDTRTASAIYEDLSSFSDTGAEALLGLARIHRLASEKELAASRYLQLGQRFGGRVNELDIPYQLLADIGAADLGRSPDASFALLRNLVARKYEAPNALLEVAAYAAAERLQGMTLNSSEQRELRSVETTLALAQRDSVFARRIATRRTELERSAGPEVRSLVAPWNPKENLVYRIGDDGMIRGVSFLEDDLQSMAKTAASGLGLHQGLIVRVEEMYKATDSSDMRRARVSLGPLMPHLALVLWDKEKSGDGFADIAEARRRHRAITVGLVVILALALWITIRGAARERELARLKSDFVSTVSHELKTPLTSIRMFAEMLEQRVAGEDREKESRYHGIIVKESERLGLLIANLLDYSQIERGIRQYADVKSPALGIVLEAAETFERTGDDLQPKITLDIAENVKKAMVHVDRQVIVQCIINLLTNAAKYGDDKPIGIQMQQSDNGDVIQLRVIDQGTGIPTSEQSKIFREFYRSPEAVRSAIEGTGLGLALVKRHVEAQGGRVSVSSIVGKGATFTIELPVVDS